MKPNIKLIKIGNNKVLIEKLLKELVLGPRVHALNWSKITKQTPNIKIGYPGQHLASLITGMEGSRTGARGDDLVDGSEVKSCSRIDQLDTCADCNEKVLRIETKCPHCNSTNIKRMNDSKWLFSIKSEEELKLLTETIDRVFLTIADYPDFDNGDYNKIRFQAFEIWVKEERHSVFKSIMTNYFHKIFIEHIKLNPNKTPAPKNFWPYSYQFYLCNPIKVFDAEVIDANSIPKIEIKHYIEPSADRSDLIPEKMPSVLLSYDERILLVNSKLKMCVCEEITANYSYQDFIDIAKSTRSTPEELTKILPFISEKLKKHLPLRDTDKISVEKVKYKRR